MAQSEIVKFVKEKFGLDIGRSTLVEHKWDSFTHNTEVKFVNPTICNPTRFQPGRRVLDYRAFTVTRKTQQYTCQNENYLISEFVFKQNLTDQHLTCDNNFQ